MAMSSASRARLIRVLKRVGIALLAIELLYLIAANVVLSGRVVGHFTNHDPVALNIQYRHAWSIIPGYVHVDDLTIRGRNDNVEWLVTIDNANLRVRLIELARKHFSATRVRVENVHVRMRFRLDPKDIESQPVAALPDISGFSNPPLLGPEPRSPMPDYENYDEWTVRLDDVVVEHAREVWIHAIKYSGDARVTGRWFFEPDRSLEIGPLHADLAALEVAYGIAPFATDAHGVLDGQIAHYDLREHGDASMLKYLSTTADLSGTVRMSLGLSSLIGIDGLQITDGQGPAHVTANIQNGVLLPGSHIDTHQSGVQLGYDLVSLGDDLNFTFDVVPDEHGINVGRGAAVGAGIVAMRRNAKASIGQAKFTVEGRKLALHTDPFADALFGLDGQELRADDLASWTDRPEVHTEGVRLQQVTAWWSLPESQARVDTKAQLGRIYSAASGGGPEQESFDAHGLLFDGGADVLLKDGIVRAAVTANVDRAHVERHTFALDTQVKVQAIAPEIRWRQKKVDLSGSRVTLSNATFVSKKKRILQAPTVTASARSLHVGGGPATGRISLAIPRAVVADASTLEALFSLPKGVSLRHGAGLGALDANVDVGTSSIDGDLSFRVPDLAVGLGKRTLAGDFVLAVHARRVGDTTRFDGSHLSFREASEDPSASWWTEATTLPSTLSWKDGPSFMGSFAGQARDASPAQVLVGEETAVPEWVATAIKVLDLRYGTELRFAKKRLALTNAFVKGDEAQLHATYVDDDGKTSGQVDILVAGIPVSFKLGVGDQKATTGPSLSRHTHASTP